MVGLKPPEVPPPATVKFVSAGMAGCIADLCTFPLDTAKRGTHPGGTAPRDAPVQHHRPLTPGSLWGWVSLRGRESRYPSSADTSMATRLLAGCTTGAVAVACAQPTDVVKVRFQASGAQWDSPRRYSGTVDAYRTIAREEGVRGLWRGTLPNIARNAIINCGELVTYDLLKDALLRAQLMT
ncbi:hypothetical protein EK904_000380, partial [Melospiza melodia maxima]